MLVTVTTDMRWVTGFEGVFEAGFHEGTDGACLITSDLALFLTDFRYQESAENAAVGTPWSVRIRSGSLLSEACEACVDERVDRVVRELAHLETQPRGTSP